MNNNSPKIFIYTLNQDSHYIDIGTLKPCLL